VTTIDITRRAIDGSDTSPKTVTVTDQGHVRAVVTAFDNLRGDFASTEPHPCGSPVGLVYTYAVTFHSADHTLVVDAGQALCGVGRALTLDSSRLPQTLEDNTQLNNALQAAFDAA
jgi:hypothetical protein